VSYVPATKTFDGKRYKLYPSRDMMNKGKAKNTAAQLRKEGKFARIVSFFSDGQPQYLVYYR